MDQRSGEVQTKKYLMKNLISKILLFNMILLSYSVSFSENIYKESKENLPKDEKELNTSTIAKDKNEVKCKIAIPIYKDNLSATRYDPESRYRSRYWTFQLKLILSIILKEAKPCILIINRHDV